MVAGDGSLERAIHAKFESALVSGEWFVRCGDLEEFIERAKRCDSINFNPRENEIQMLPNITYELLKRGYSEPDIVKILGGNFLRVFSQAEMVSRKMSRTISGGGSTRRINK